MKKWVYNVLIIICAVVFLFAAYKLITILVDYHQNRVLQGEIQDLFHSNNNSANRVDGSDESGRRWELDKEGLELIRNYNEDTVGWLEIPCANVDHPVVQSYDNDFYLHRDFYKGYRYAGTMFMDYRNELSGKYQNIIVYGHHMGDGSMFGKLGNYLNQNVYERNKTFTFITPDTVYTCEIFAVYQCLTDFPYAQPVLVTEENFLNYIEMCREASIYQTDVEIGADDMVITLSTCDKRYDEENGRLVVQAKMTPMAIEAAE